MATAFDETQLLERIDNDVAFLGETVQMLASDGNGLLDQARRAIAAGDAPALGSAAHALKGMISNFCSPRTQECALELERIGKGGNLAPAPEALRRLDEHLQALVGELLRFVETRS